MFFSAALCSKSWNLQENWRLVFSYSWKYIKKLYHIFQDLKETIVLMQGIIDEETTDIINVTLSTNGTDRVNKLAKLIKVRFN